ncbi:MAG: hypothetical protein EHM51_02770 [Geobacter sp.]|nr:MAG: hypothetical protein EHM51_02770 [Geobacter sp.]
MVLLRNYGTGDARNANRTKEQSYQVVVTLRRPGREAALAKKDSLEMNGFTVNQYGEITVSDN